ncbi:amino acid transporter [Paenibacillus oryzae]|uniref:Amino acid transporter n=1 Tax=Paenibacillus oryzae TaxID=1844972 RepID=A0A1A5YA85_9BACL|nr:amino acid transporter [Paenibacillus oryzae]
MNHSLKQQIEQIVGRMAEVIILDEQGCTSEVSRIMTTEGSFILKSVTKEKYRSWLMNEAKVLKDMGRQKSIPLPKYIGFFEDKHSSHLLMSYEPGSTLTAAIHKAESESEKLVLIRSFGQFLNRFHMKEVSAVVQNDGDWLKRQLSTAREYVEGGLTSGSPQLLRFLECNKPDPVLQTIVHGDCTTDNVLVLDGKAHMFIDVSGMTIGDPRYDETLAISHFHDNPAFLHAFYEGYTRYKVSREEVSYFEGLYEFF